MRWNVTTDRWALLNWVVGNLIQRCCTDSKNKLGVWDKIVPSIFLLYFAQLEDLKLQVCDNYRWSCWINVDDSIVLIILYVNTTQYRCWHQRGKVCIEGWTGWKMRMSIHLDMDSFVDKLCSNQKRIWSVCHYNSSCNEKSQILLLKQYVIISPPLLL